MRQSSFSAIYDANVLYPAPLRSFLMYLALTGAYRAHWSECIHNEWKRNLLKNDPARVRADLDQISAAMDRAMPDALVTGYESLIPGLKLPDAGDRHVVAAAIKCRASVIVTFNLKDFPKDVLANLGVEAVHPDEFIADIWDLDKAAVLEAARKHRSSLLNPPFEAAAYLGMMLRQRLPQTVSLLSAFELLL